MQLHEEFIGHDEFELPVEYRVGQLVKRDTKIEDNNNNFKNSVLLHRDDRFNTVGEKILSGKEHKL